MHIWAAKRYGSITRLDYHAVKIGSQVSSFVRVDQMQRGMIA